MAATRGTKKASQYRLKTSGTVKGGTKKATTKPRTKRAPVVPALKVVNQDIVIQPVQYAVMDEYVIENEHTKGTIPDGFIHPRNEYGDSYGDSQRYKVNNSHVYRTADNQAFMQFPCGDYLFLNIDHMIELLQSVKKLEITTQPRYRDE